MWLLLNLKVSNDEEGQGGGIGQTDTWTLQIIKHNMGLYLIQSVLDLLKNKKTY